MNGLRWLVAVTVATGLAGCGGSHRRASVRPPARAAPQAAPAPSPLALVLPASVSGPTTCTVYESGFATQVVFDSQSLNVSGECEAWTSRESGSGYLWAYQPTAAAIDATAVPVCDLQDPSGRVTATVIGDTGFAPLSSVQRNKLATACRSLVAAGWVRSTRRQAVG